MLSLFANVMNTATRQDEWTRPDHRSNQSSLRSNAQHERQEAALLRRANRNLVNR